MKIGVVSDLHRHLPFFVEQAFKGCDRIVCAGDTEDERLLWQLQTIAPITNVRGNNDWSFDVPFTVTCTWEDVTFFIVHRPQDIGVPAEGIDVVIHGHTHIPRDEIIDGVRYLNPGSPTLPRRGGAPSCMVLEVLNGKLQDVQIIEGR